MENEDETNIFDGNFENTDLTNSFNSLLEANNFLTPDLSSLTPASKGSIGNYFAGNLSQAPTGPDKYNLQSYGPDFVQSLSQSSYDPYKYAKPIKFNASRHGENFNRYYSHEAFSELGFIPFRDNESLYNANSTAYQDWQRGNDHFFNLVWSGMKSGFRSWGDLLSGDALTPDYITAEEQAEAMAVGYSSRGGIGAFANNFVLNSAHTIGILAEMALEEAALLGITALSEGTAAGVTIPTMFARGLNAFKKIAKGLPTVNKFGKASKNLNNAMGQLNDVNKARQYWKTAANFLNPLERTTDYIRSAKNSQNFLEFTKNHSLFGSFYRDVREINFALAESKLEGGLVANEMSEELYNKFYMENGRTPYREEADEISKIANKAGFATVGWNLPIIYSTNKLVFDNMFKGFRPFTRAGGSKLDNALGGRLIFDRRATKKGLDPFRFEEVNLRNSLKALYKPSTYGRVGLSYLKANFAEGAQEIFQEIVAGTAKDYYTDIYSDDVTRGGIYHNIGNNISKQISWGGFEIFMSGFLMGGMIRPITSIPTYAMKTSEYLSDREGYKAKKEDRRKRRDDIAQNLNDLYKDPLKYFAPEMENLTTAKVLNDEMQKAEKEGDRKKFQDLKQEANYNHIITAIQTGKIDFFKNYMSSMKEMSNEELEQAFGYNVPESKLKDFYSKIDKVVSRASKIEARYEYLHKRFQNPFNPSKYDMTDDPVKYIEESMRYVAYNQALKEGTFMIHSFDRTLERMNSIYTDLRSGSSFFGLKSGQLAGALAHDVNILFGNINSEGGSAETDVLNEITTLTNEIEVLKDGTPEQKKTATKKKRKLNALIKLSEEMANLRSLLEIRGVTMKDSGQLEFDDKNDELEKSRKKTYDAYKSYLQVIANINGEFVDTEQIENSFKLLMDYTELNNEAEILTRSINLLLDPSGTPFVHMAERQYEIDKEIYNRKLEDIKKAMAGYQDKMDTNQLLEDLFEAGYFFDPEEIHALINDNVLPSRFYRIADKQVIEKDSHPRDWEIIMKIINEWGEVTDKPIPERETDTRYNAKGRRRYKRDKRTYADYAKQFGFDPEAEETQVSQKFVLKSIIESKLSTPREKRLAEALLKNTNDGDKILFVNYSTTPGLYENKRVKVDARYFSSDYSTGDNAIEHTINHEIIHKLTVTSFNEDENYKVAITKLFQAAQDHWEKTSKKGEKEFYGLKDPYEFIAEAMTNDVFQGYLKGIKYEGTQKSVWEEFLSVVSKFLAKVLGIRGTSNILDETIALTTRKIEGIETAVKDKIGFTVTDEFSKLAPQLQKQLKEAYKTYQDKIGDKGEISTLEGWMNESDTARNIINNYNKGLETGEKEVIEEDLPASELEGTTEQSPVIKHDFTEVEKEKLKGGGRKVFVADSTTNKNMNIKGPSYVYVDDVRYEIIPRGRQTVDQLTVAPTKLEDQLIVDLEDETIKSWFEDPEATLYAYEIIVRPERQDVGQDEALAIMNIRSRYKKIKTKAQLQEWIKQARNIFSTVPFKVRESLGYTSEEVDGLYNEKLNELGESPKFDEVKLGDFIILKDKDIVRKQPLLVIKKTKNQMILEDQSSKETITVNRKGFEKRIKSIVDPSTFVSETTEITEAETSHLEDNAKNAKDKVKDPAAIARLNKKAKDKSIEEVNDDFINNLGCE